MKILILNCPICKKFQRNCKFNRLVVISFKIIINQRRYNLRLPKLTKEGNAVTILKIRANDPSEISNYYHCLAHALNIVEVRLAEEISIRDVVIFDCEGFGMTHLLRITPTFLKHVSLIFTVRFH